MKTNVVGRGPKSSILKFGAVVAFFVILIGLMLAGCQDNAFFNLPDDGVTAQKGWSVSDEAMLDMDQLTMPNSESTNMTEPGDGLIEYMALVSDGALTDGYAHWVKTYYMAGFDTCYGYAEIPSTGFGLYGPRHTTCTYPDYKCGPDPLTWFGPMDQLPTEVRDGDPFASMCATKTNAETFVIAVCDVNPVDFFTVVRNTDGTFNYAFSLTDDPETIMVDDYRMPKLAGRNECGGEVLYQNFFRYLPDGGTQKLAISWQEDMPVGS